MDFAGHFIDKGLCYGSDNIVSYAAVNLVRDNLIPEVKYMLASVIIPFFYIGLVFVCVAVTVLSVQQLSDSAKHKERYEVLKKLGVMLASVIIPFFYIGLVFVCVAVTVLSVQQLSDSAKHKERYEVLKKLGVGSRKIRGLVAKQLVAY